LAATIVELNAALAAGRAAELPVPRGGSPPPLRPPLIAMPLAVGLTYSIGGPRIDHCGRVVNAARHPIPGLYAAGTTAGGLGGGPKTATASGIGGAGPPGYLAGTPPATSRTARAAPGRPV